jgi:hypothetical protein
MPENVRRTRAVRCSECSATAHDTPHGWIAQVVGGYDGDAVEVVVLCPDCAEREAGAADEPVHRAGLPGSSADAERGAHSVGRSRGAPR